MRATQRHVHSASSGPPPKAAAAVAAHGGGLLLSPSVMRPRPPRLQQQPDSTSGSGASSSSSSSVRRRRLLWCKSVAAAVGSACVVGVVVSRWREPARSPGWASSSVASAAQEVAQAASGCVSKSAEGGESPARRVGIRYVSKRPVVPRVPACPEAAEVVDAGWCFEMASGTGEGQAYCLPSFIVGGMQKAATGWLRQWLSMHPDLAQGGDHEVHYFDTLPLGGEDSNEWLSYLSRFPVPVYPARSYYYTFEKTPDYIPNATAMAAIKALLPSVKLVVMLRNPTSRAYSAFQHHCRRLRFGTLPSRRASSSSSSSSRRRTSRFRGARPGSSRVVFSLEAAADEWRRAEVLVPPCSPLDFGRYVTERLNDTRLVAWGRYVDHLEAAVELFDHSQLYVAFSETALREADAFLDDLVSWLGLRTFDFAKLPTFVDALGRTQLALAGFAGIWQRLSLSSLNVDMLHKHSFAPLERHTKAFLDAHFRPFNNRLDHFLLYQAPALAVFPPRHSLDDAAAAAAAATSREAPDHHHHHNTHHHHHSLAPNSSFGPHSPLLKEPARSGPGFAPKRSLLPPNWAT